MADLMVEIIKALLSRLTTRVVLQLGVTLPTAYVVASVWELDFWMIVSVLAIPILVWHGYAKPYRDKTIEKREKDKERGAKQEQTRRRIIRAALVAVEGAYRAASTRTLNGVLDPTLTGQHYDTLMYARNATDAAAQFIENPPPPLEKVAFMEHLEQWLVALRNA